MQPAGNNQGIDPDTGEHLQSFVTQTVKLVYWEPHI
jgi:hypothetical protein